MDFRKRAEQGLIVFDGAMGTQIHAHEPSDADWAGLQGCSEILCQTRPDIIKEIHAAYFQVGADVVETNSFGGNEIVLHEYGIADRARELSRLAASLARDVADNYSTPEKPRFVAGSIGPGTKLISLGQTDWATMHHSYVENIAGLVEGGVDLLLIETCQDLLEIKCVLDAARDVFAQTGKSLPIIVTVTVETTGTLLVGSELAAVITTLEPYDIFALGMNCATGPADMKQYVQQLSRTWRGRILVQPNAGLPQNINGRLGYTMKPEDFVSVVKTFVEEDGITMVGGCCGTNPDFIKLLANEAKNWTPAIRHPQNSAAVASLFSTQTMTQVPAPFYIGERTNTNGSKIFREALLRDDWDGLVDIAREQVQSGVHALDVCVAYTGRNEKNDMHEALKRFVTQINMPLVIDSTELPVMESALQMYGGRAIINSVNLEDGEGRADKVCTLARRYGAALIALTIDEKGMARSVDEKVAVAKRIYALGVDRHGLRPEDLIFDALTFTLGSGDETLRDSAKNTIEGIRRIKAELPGVRTVLGLSNVSFGLAVHARPVLNSVFLSACVEAGLDMAIVNLKHIRPLARIEEQDRKIAEDLLYNQRNGTEDPVFAFIRHFESRAGVAADEGPAEDTLSLEDRIKSRIVQGSKAKLQELLLEALPAYGAIGIINDLLIPSMKVVGELFGSGKMQLPFVLQSAEVMKAAVDILQPYMEKKEGEEQLSIVLATVRGDVHDIGKNLVDIILSNNGYKVHNLGIKVDVDEMYRVAKEKKASAIGMSGLLVKSTVIMKENLEELSRRQLKIPVLLGGAALTPGYVYDTCRPVAPDSLVYCSDAFEGLRAMNLIKEGKLEEWLAAEASRRASRKPVERLSVVDEKPVIIRRDVAVPKPPFFGVKIVPSVDLEAVFSYLTEEVLFRGRWGYRRGTLSKEEYEALVESTVRPQFEALKAKAKAEGLLQPAVAYGYFACNAIDQDVVIYAPDTGDELTRFSFPRQTGGARQCIADYFLPKESGVRDVIALQVTTVGAKADKECHRLYESGNYKDYLLFHGLSVECAEALAEYWHLVVRQELGITEEDGQGIQDFVVQKYRGSRYSFGYPACPDLAQNRILCNTVHSERIGVVVGEEDQMVPEQTTSAFVVHHPQAKYFNA